MINNRDYVTLDKVTDRSELFPMDMITISHGGIFMGTQFVCLTGDSELDKELGYDWILRVHINDPRVREQTS